MADDWTPEYSRWRHGGWYVHNVTYPSGAVGCVTRNFTDKKWRIACDSRPFEEQPTFRNRDAAARAERDLALAEVTSGREARAERVAAGGTGYEELSDWTIDHYLMQRDSFMEHTGHDRAQLEVEKSRRAALILR